MAGHAHQPWWELTLIGIELLIYFCIGVAANIYLLRRVKQVSFDIDGVNWEGTAERRHMNSPTKVVSPLHDVACWYLFGLCFFGGVRGFLCLTIWLFRDDHLLNDGVTASARRLQDSAELPSSAAFLLIMLCFCSFLVRVSSTSFLGVPYLRVVRWRRWATGATALSIVVSSALTWLGMVQGFITSGEGEYVSAVWSFVFAAVLVLAVARLRRVLSRGWCVALIITSMSLALRGALVAPIVQGAAKQPPVWLQLERPLFFLTDIIPSCTALLYFAGRQRSPTFAPPPAS